VKSFMKKYSLSILSVLGLFVGSMAATTQTFFWTQQVKCPKELLK